MSFYNIVIFLINFAFYGDKKIIIYPLPQVVALFSSVACFSLECLCYLYHQILETQKL